jgi:hypothetical protein
MPLPPAVMTATFSTDMVTILVAREHLLIVCEVTIIIIQDWVANQFSCVFAVENLSDE